MITKLLESYGVQGTLVSIAISLLMLMWAILSFMLPFVVYAMHREMKRQGQVLDQMLYGITKLRK